MSSGSSLGAFLRSKLGAAFLGLVALSALLAAAAAYGGDWVSRPIAPAGLGLVLFLLLSGGGFFVLLRHFRQRVERERVQALLKQSEERFHDFAASASDWFWEQDENARFTYVSGAASHRFGLRADSLIGKTPREVDDGLSEEAWRAHEVDLAARRPFRDFRTQRRRKNGSIQHFAISGRPYFGAGGRFLGYRGVTRDITREVAAEAELKARQSELAQKTEMLETILDNIESGFSAYDGDFRLIAWNELYLKFNMAPPGFIKAGMPLEVVIRRNASSGLYGADIEAGIAKRLAELRALVPRRDIHERANGQIIENVIRPLPTGGFLSLLTDITEERLAETKRRQLELHLRHSQRLEALGTLAGGIAHDLNNSLVPVVGLTKLLMSRLPIGSRERRSLDLIRQAGVRSSDLVKRILAFSRKDAPHLDRFDLAGIIGEAMGMLRASIPATIRLESEISVAAPMLGDSGQLYQVIVNLLTNAAQAIDERTGAIHVALSETGGDKLPQSPYLHLSVRDTGCGIPESMLDRIFEPFFTTKEVGKGTGLGLSVVHGIVTSHGGKIEVTSRLGEGTEFHLYLPRDKSAIQSAA